jgi:hypothetical protein
MFRLIVTIVLGLAVMSPASMAAGSLEATPAKR